MTDLTDIATLKAAIAAVLNNGVPDESIEPDDHNTLLDDLLDTITGLDKVLRANNETGGFNLTISAGDLLKIKSGTFTGDFTTEVLTGGQTYTFQDATGTVAFLSDITGGATNLSEGSSTTTTVDVDSDTGTNATLLAASALRAGVMPSAKFAEVVANNAKPSEAPNDGTQYARKNLGWEALAGSNLYTADGTLTAARTVTMGGNKLDFLGLNTGFGLSTYAGDAPAAIHVKSTNADSSIRAYNSSNQTDYTLKTNTTTGGELAILLANVRKIQIIASGNTYFNGGNVAIGTSAPNSAYKLTVAGGGIIATTAGATSGTNGFLATNSLTQNLLRLRNDGQMILGTSGYAGDASAVIQLNSTNADSAIRVYNQNNTLNFSFKSTVAIGGEFNMYTGAGAQVIKLQGTGNNYINSGDFGVGTSSPTAKLHVNGSTLLNGNLGVFGTTPIAQPTTAIIAPAAVAVGGVDVQTNDTFEGYTIAQVVRALRNLGVLA